MNQRLYLVRHAIACPRDDPRWIADSERPLNADGIRHFRRVAAGVAGSVPAPLRVFSSPSLRAWQTAELLCAIGWPSPEVLPALAPGGDLSEVLESLPADARLALVGHAPDLSRLAALLLVGNPDALTIELKKGGVLALDRDLDAGRAELKWLAAPGLLRRMA